MGSVIVYLLRCSNFRSHIEIIGLSDNVHLL